MTLNLLTESRAPALQASVEDSGSAPLPWGGHDKNLRVTCRLISSEPGRGWLTVRVTSTENHSPS